MADMKVSFEKLNDHNFAVWKFKMELLLVKEDLMDVVEKEKPADAKPEWVQKDGKARATIGLAVEDTQLVHIIRQKTAKGMWDSLKKIHEESSLASTLHVLRKLCSLRLSEEGNLLEHLNEMTALHNQLEVMGEGLKDRVFMALILSSLPLSYGSLINVIESKPEAEVTVDFVKSKLREEWRRRQVCEGDPESKEKALKIVSDKNKKDNKKKKELSCHFCHQPGHFKRKCPKFLQLEREKKEAEKVNLAAEDLDDSEMCLVVGAPCDENRWIVDSGATSHMTSNVKLLSEVDRSKSVDIWLADGTRIKSGGSGTGKIVSQTGSGKRMNVTINDVYHVPVLAGNILSVGKICDLGYSVVFEKAGCRVLRDKEALLVGERIDGLYRLKQVPERAMVSTVKHPELCEHLWHRRLGHRDTEAIMKIVRNDLGFGLKLQKCSVECVCGVCQEGKMSRSAFPKRSESKSTAVGDLVHSDVGGPMEVATPSGNRFYMTMVDDFSGYTVVYLLKAKAEVDSKVREYCNMMKNQFGRFPRKIRADGGGEYSSTAFKKFLAENGIILEQTAPYSPQQNGKAERKNRYEVEMVRCLLLEAGLDKKYWGEALCTANYLQNRLPSSVLEKTPYELWHNKKPCYVHLRIFGSEAYVHVPKEKRRKLDPKAVKLVFVGYAEGRKAYRFLDPETDRVVISRDAKFVEVNGVKESVRNQEILEKSVAEPEVKETEGVVVSLGGGKPEANGSLPADDSDDELEAGDEDLEAEDNEELDPSQYEVTSEGDSSFLGFPLDEIARRSARSTKGLPPRRLIEEIFAAGTLSPEEEKEPKTLREALSCEKSAEWRRAMAEELKSHESNGTWELVDPPAGRKPVGCKWVYKIKRNAAGEPVKYKARLVAQGFCQKYGQDYDEVFAPVIRQTTLRALLAIASKRNLVLKHFDVKTAYLYGELEEELYMRQPTGFVKEGRENQVCRLRRSIYGLKQSARCWNQRLHTVLQGLGFEQSKADPCLYTKVVNGKRIYVLVYVDDILIGCESEEEIGKVYTSLSKEFEMTNLGDANYFLGMEITKERGRYGISLQGYIERTAEKFGMGDAKTAKSPMEEGFLKTREDSPLLATNTRYRSLVGALLYIAVCARPDIAASVSILGRQVSAPRKADWVAARRVVRYLKETKEYRLVYGDPEGLLTGYSDADWAGDLETRRSRTGTVFMYAGGAISWTSRLQDFVTLSSMESEYVAMSEASQEAVWLLNLFEDLGEPLLKPLTLWEDNQSCIKFVSSQRATKRSRHIETRECYVKELCERNVLRLQYCPTAEMAADLLTKALGPIKLQRFAAMLGLSGIGR